MRVVKPWTEADDQQLLSLVQQGRNNTAIARELGRTRGAVEGRKSKLKPPAPAVWPVTDADTASRRLVAALGGVMPWGGA